MVLEQKVGNPKYYFAEGEQIQEVRSVTRWKCVVNIIIFYRINEIFEADLRWGRTQMNYSLRLISKNHIHMVVKMLYFQMMILLRFKQ